MFVPRNPRVLRVLALAGFLAADVTATSAGGTCSQTSDCATGLYCDTDLTCYTCAYIDVNQRECDAIEQSTAAKGVNVCCETNGPLATNCVNMATNTLACTDTAKPTFAPSFSPTTRSPTATTLAPTTKSPTASPTKAPTMGTITWTDCDTSDLVLTTTGGASEATFTNVQIPTASYPVDAGTLSYTVLYGSVLSTTLTGGDLANFGPQGFVTKTLTTTVSSSNGAPAITCTRKLIVNPNDDPFETLVLTVVENTEDGTQTKTPITGTVTNNVYSATYTIQDTTRLYWITAVQTWGSESSTPTNLGQYEDVSTTVTLISKAQQSSITGTISVQLSRTIILPPEWNPADCQDMTAAGVTSIEVNANGESNMPQWVFRNCEFTSFSYCATKEGVQWDQITRQAQNSTVGGAFDGNPYDITSTSVFLPGDYKVTWTATSNDGNTGVDCIIRVIGETDSSCSTVTAVYTKADGTQVTTTQPAPQVQWDLDGTPSSVTFTSTPASSLATGETVTVDFETEGYNTVVTWGISCYASQYTTLYPNKVTSSLTSGAFTGLTITGGDVNVPETACVLDPPFDANTFVYQCNFNGGITNRLTISPVVNTGTTVTGNFDAASDNSIAITSVPFSTSGVLFGSYQTDLSSSAGTTVDYTITVSFSQPSNVVSTTWYCLFDLAYDGLFSNCDALLISDPTNIFGCQRISSPIGVVKSTTAGQLAANNQGSSCLAIDSARRLGEEESRRKDALRSRRSLLQRSRARGGDAQEAAQSGQSRAGQRQSDLVATITLLHNTGAQVTDSQDSPVSTNWLSSTNLAAGITLASVNGIKASTYKDLQLNFVWGQSAGDLGFIQRKLINSTTDSIWVCGGLTPACPPAADLTINLVNLGSVGNQIGFWGISDIGFIGRVQIAALKGTNPIQTFINYNRLKPLATLYWVPVTASQFRLGAAFTVLVDISGPSDQTVSVDVVAAGADGSGTWSDLANPSQIVFSGGALNQTLSGNVDSVWTNMGFSSAPSFDYAMKVHFTSLGNCGQGNLKIDGKILTESALVNLDSPTFDLVDFTIKVDTPQPNSGESRALELNCTVNVQFQLSNGDPIPYGYVSPQDYHVIIASNAYSTTSPKTPARKTGDGPLYGCPSLKMLQTLTSIINGRVGTTTTKSLIGNQETATVKPEQLLSDNTLTDLSLTDLDLSGGDQAFDIQIVIQPASPTSPSSTDSLCAPFEFNVEVQGLPGNRYSLSRSSVWVKGQQNLAESKPETVTLTMLQTPPGTPGITSGASFKITPAISTLSFATLATGFSLSTITIKESKISISSAFEAVSGGSTTEVTEGSQFKMKAIAASALSTSFAFAFYKTNGPPSRNFVTSGAPPFSIAIGQTQGFQTSKINADGIVGPDETIGADFDVTSYPPASYVDLSTTPLSFTLVNLETATFDLTFNQPEIVVTTPATLKVVFTKPVQKEAATTITLSGETMNVDEVITGGDCNQKIDASTRKCVLGAGKSSMDIGISWASGTFTGNGGFLTVTVNGPFAAVDTTYASQDKYITKGSTTQLRIEVVKSVTCRDGTTIGPHGDCDSYKPGGLNFGFCSQDEWAQLNCKATCNTCDTNSPTTPAPTSAPSATKAPTPAPQPTFPTMWPTSAPAVGPWTVQCKDNPSFTSAYGDCNSYNETQCLGNPLCNHKFCFIDDGVAWNCPRSCYSCNQWPGWESPYGDCNSYKASDTKCTSEPNCNNDFCSADVGVGEGNVDLPADVACRSACNTEVYEPNDPAAIPLCPAADSTTWDAGYGGCATYDAALCGSNPDCNHQYCFYDKADFMNACPIACKQCNGCDALPDNTCTPALCSGQPNLAPTDPLTSQVDCVAKGAPGNPDARCFCDASCRDNDNCCPGYTVSCEGARSRSRGEDSSRSSARNQRNNARGATRENGSRSAAERPLQHSSLPDAAEVTTNHRAIRTRGRSSRGL